MVEYFFRLRDGREHAIRIDLAREPRPKKVAADRPEWTSLKFHQCTNCSLRESETPVCPPAYDVRETLRFFSDIVSYEVIDVRVKTPEREYAKQCDVQSALMSLFGLTMASSGCPILGELRAMAVFHLPFSTPTETVYRTTANHLLKQFFAAKRGEPPDFSLGRLRALYAELETLNQCFFERVRAAAAEDANLNAVTRLLAVSLLVTASMDEGLVEMERLFPAKPRS